MQDIFEVLRGNYTEAARILRGCEGSQITFATWQDGAYYPNDGFAHSDLDSTMVECPRVVMDGKDTIVIAAKYNDVENRIDIQITNNPLKESDGVWYDLYSVDEFWYWTVLQSIDKWHKPKVYVVRKESNVDGIVVVDFVPCRDLNKARKVLQEEKNVVLRLPKYCGCDIAHPSPDYVVEDREGYFLIKCCNDDYYEEFEIVKKELL